MIYGGQGKTTCNAMVGTDDKRIAGDNQLGQNCVDNASAQQAQWQAPRRDGMTVNTHGMTLVK